MNAGSAFRMRGIEEFEYLCRRSQQGCPIIEDYINGHLFQKPFESTFIRE